MQLRKLIPIYFVIFMGFIGYSMTIVLFTAMVLDSSSLIVPTHLDFGQRAILLGVLLAMYPIGQFFGAPILGNLSDQYGRRKILLVALSCSVVLYIAIALSLMLNNLIFLFIALFLTGLPQGNIAIGQSAIADCTTQENRSRLFGYINLSASSAYIVGPLIGGKLADHKIVSWFNYATPFWLVTILLFFLFIWVYLIFKETHPPKKDPHFSPLSSLTTLAQLFTDKDIRYYYFVNFFFYLAIFGYFRVFPMYLVQKFHLTLSLLSEMVAYVAVPIILVSLFVIGPLSKRFSDRNLTIVSSFAMGICILIAIIPNTFWPLWITLFITTFFLTIAMVFCATLISHKAGAKKQGVVMGNNQSLQVGAEALSGFLGGILAAVFIRLPMITAAICAMLGASLLLCKNSKNNM